jgi:hypothetical protein
LEVKIIEKDAKNPHFKNQYASLDTIVDEVRPLLAKHGLVMMQFPGGDGEKFTLRSMLLHESGEWIESEPITMRPVKNDPQGIGSCSTYARRYSLSAMLSLNTGDDDDGNGASGDPVKTPYKAPASPVQPSQPYTPNQQNAASQSSSNATKSITDNQVKLVHTLKSRKHITDEDFRRMIAEYSDGNTETKQLTMKQAIEFINFLTAYEAS